MLQKHYEHTGMMEMTNKMDLPCIYGILMVLCIKLYILVFAEHICQEKHKRKDTYAIDGVLSMLERVLQFSAIDLFIQEQTLVSSVKQVMHT